MIDTHAHLDACADPGLILERARAAGVTRVVTIGTGVESCLAALALAHEHRGVFAAVGIDPHRAGTPEAGRVAELRPLLDDGRVVAVGEAGLDNHHAAGTPLEQRRLFDEQLELAASHGLPMVVHSRDAAAETAEALAGFPGTVILHCFSDPALLDVALARRYYVSFAGNVTYPSAEALRTAARLVPEDSLLVETDAPYLAPQPVRGRPSEPAHVAHTIARLADVRGVDAGSLASRIDANAETAFGLQPER